MKQTPLLIYNGKKKIYDTFCRKKFRNLIFFLIHRSNEWRTKSLANSPARPENAILSSAKASQSCRQKMQCLQPHQKRLP